jgi:two-component system, cell cycle sensor histidine kinase and response regulator CckA
MGTGMSRSSFHVPTARDALVARSLHVTPAMNTAECLKGQGRGEKVFAVFSGQGDHQGIKDLLGLVHVPDGTTLPPARFADLVPAYPPIVIDEALGLEEIWDRMKHENVEVVAAISREGTFLGTVSQSSLVHVLFCHQEELRLQIEHHETDIQRYRQRLKALSRKLENTGEAYRSLLRLLVRTSIEEDLLQAAIKALAELIHARYGAIMLMETDGRLMRMLYTGLTSEEAHKIGKLPEGRGLLGVDVEEGGVLRIEDIASDPRAGGFPPNHPVMRSVLIAPIVNEGQTYGRVYLADKFDGQPFSEDDGLIVQSFSHSLALVAGYVRAVEERKHAQEATAYVETQLRQAQKLEALGRLAGGVAHDFNNLLTAIMGYGELTLCRPASDGGVRRNIEEILRAARRGANLVKQLLAFASKHTSEREVVSVSGILSELSPMLHRLIGEDIQVTIRTDPHPGSVLIDPGQMEQVIINLVVNARDAMPRGGELIIETTRMESEQTKSLHLGSLKPGPYVVLSVKDTGCGMSREVLSRIFDPFFTTKEPGKGTGLGLSTVYGIITQHDGALSVKSDVGQGTTFHVYLPHVETQHRNNGAYERSLPPLEGTETIFVVEDEPEIRTLICQNLRSLGYTVLDADNGADALDIARYYTQPIHLLLTDMIMPRLGGQALADHLLSLHPEMKVLYVSGYMNQGFAPEDALSEDSTFLRKPFTLEALGRKIRELLDGGPRNPKQTEG